MRIREGLRSILNNYDSWDTNQGKRILLTRFCDFYEAINSF